MSDLRLPCSGAHWVDHVARHAHSRPDAVALRFDGVSTTWRELHDRLRRLATGLSARGVVKGDRVAVLMTNRPEFLEAVLAANLLGAIAVPRRDRAPSAGGGDRRAGHRSQARAAQQIRRSRFGPAHGFRPGLRQSMDDVVSGGGAVSQ
jgi:acyl-CoA synthetase (AMP-forming)/AMP-acid ligase II